MTSVEEALNIRIATHHKFSKYEINDWILSTLKLRRGEKILDVGCGNGKQLIPYSKAVGRDGLAVGIDVSNELVEEARRRAEAEKVSVQLRQAPMENLSSSISGQTFDVVSCCFALYYSKDYSRTISDFHRVLGEGGRCFVCGPMKGNNAELAELHQRVAKLPEAFLEHTKFMVEKALPIFRQKFKRVETSLFENPVIFPDKPSLLEYWRSYTLFEEDAKSRFEKIVESTIEEKGSFTTHKVVLGILAFK